jgi:hypothetical protein
MDDNNDLLQRISKLERSSRMAVPFGIVAMIAILAAIFFTSKELQQSRAELTIAEEALAKTQTEIDRAQAKLDALNKTLATISAKGGAELDDEDLGTALAQVANIDSTLAVATARVAQSQMKSVDTPYGAMSIDIFYCAESGAANMALAKKIMALREGRASGRWRMRELSAVTNASKGYHLTMDTIRFNADERQVAEQLQKDTQSVTGSEVKLQLIKYATPGYISLFLCGAK